jgi:hypothetical protein
MNSLIKFLDAESKKQNRRITAAELRPIIDKRLQLYRMWIDELEELRTKTYSYDEMEKELLEIHNQAVGN